MAEEKVYYRKEEWHKLFKELENRRMNLNIIKISQKVILNHNKKGIRQNSLVPFFTF